MAKLGQNLILILYSALSTSKIPYPDSPIYLFIRLTSWLLKNIVLLVIYTFLTSLDHLLSVIGQDVRSVTLYFISLYYL